MSKSIVSFFKAKSDDSSALYKSLLPPSVVQSVLKEVKKVNISDEKKGCKRGSYAIFSAKDKAIIAKCASENGVTASLKLFKGTGEFTDINEPTVRGWVMPYRYELSSVGATAMSIIFLL